MSTTTLNPELLKTRPHFEILDGLRGIAAIAIVVFHFMEMVYLPDKNFLAHGFLAVDFFFCLSGFVIAYAYNDRIAKIGLLTFFKLRLIRLYPLIILGSVLGLLAYLFDPFGGNPNVYSAGKTFLIFLTSLFLIPFPVIEERSFNLFGLNAPAWSLFWEFVANIVYAIILFRLDRRILIVLAVIAGTAVCYVAYQSGNLLGGWGSSSFWDGFVRISYSFTIGLLIYRFKLIIKNKLGFVGLSVLLLLVFFIPSTASSDKIVEPLIILFYFPLLVSLGAGAVLSPGIRKLCVFSGNISYPLYMTHYAAIWMFANYYAAYKPSTPQLTLIIIAGTVLLVGIAYLAMVFYDIPVRKYLNSKTKKAIQNS